MFLARMLTKNSLQQIGLYFGGTRSHDRTACLSKD